MRATSTLFGFALVAGLSGLLACGGAEPPPAAPPPPPPPPAETAPVASAAPTDTTPPAPPPKPAMSDMQQTTIKAVLAAFNAHDAKAVGAAYTTDAVVKSATHPDMTGRDAVVAAWTANFTALPDTQVGFSRALLKGNVAVVSWAFTATDSGPGLMGKPTKRAVGHEGTSVLWFSDDGLVKEEHDYADEGVTKAQLDPKAKAGSFRPVPTLPASMQVVVSTGGPDEDALLATGNKLYTVEDTLKVKDVLPFFTDDVTFNDYSSPAPIKGAKELAKLFGTYIKAFPDLHQMPLTNQWAIGTYLVSEGVMQGTNKGPMMGMAATKKPIAVHFVDVVQMNGGKAQVSETYMNSVEMLTQLGVIKPADTGAKPKK
jgi:ketosteroid isomerase-like protein